MQWSRTHEAKHGDRWHLWAELLDEHGQPLRGAPGSNAFIVAAFDHDRNAALRKIEADKPRVARLVTT